jgi:ankyrin repeat protein
MVKFLLAQAETPADTINCRDKDGRTAFHYACLNDDKPLLTALLTDSRVDVALRTRNQETGLHLSSLYAALEAMTLLHLDGRLSLSDQNKFGETPLHLCAGSGDKGAAKAAALLLTFGASLAVTDRWGRGPMDVSMDNAESGLLHTFAAHLEACGNTAEVAEVNAVSAAYKVKKEEPEHETEDKVKANRAAAFSVFGQLGGVKLKKTKTVVKTMFNDTEGRVVGSSGDGLASVRRKPMSGDGRKALSKTIDFPGDVDEITKAIANTAEIDPAGVDSYGLTALHKFASWNKLELLNLLLPVLGPGELELTCPEGKTALHWAVEMAAVAAIQRLVAVGADVEARDGKGRTVTHILDAVPQTAVIDRIRAALVSVSS